MNREKVMSWLEGLAQQDWRMFHSDSEVRVIAEHVLALLKEQERIIKLYEKTEPFLYSHGWNWTQVEGWVKQE